MITSALQTVSVVREPANGRCSVCAEQKSGYRNRSADGWLLLKALQPEGSADLGFSPSSGTSGPVNLGKSSHRSDTQLFCL